MLMAQGAWWKLGAEVLLVAASSLVMACAKPAAEMVPQARPNLILISLDTVRTDHLGCYGYEIPNTPFLNALSQRATVFSHAYATAPWTLPSHASIFTGKYPHQHGAHTYKTEKPGPNASPLPLEQTTLAEVLSQLGYRTAAFVANKQYLATRFQLNQGFQTYYVFSGPEVARAEEVNAQALAWLDYPTTEQPFFLFLNYMDAHRPYRSEGHTDLFPFPVGTDCARLQSRLLEPILCGYDLDQAGEDYRQDLAQLSAQYDVAIANLDQQLEALFQQLKQKNLLSNTVVVITSDHGEYFGEHQLLKHSKDVYQEALHVPLLVLYPLKPEPQTIDAPTSIAQIPSLVFQALPPVDAAVAEKAMPPLSTELGLIAENYYSRARDLFDVPWGNRFHRVRHVLFADGWKYIHSSDGQHELYNLVLDPQEHNNLLAQQSQRAASMRERLEQQLESAASSSTPLPLGYSEDELDVLDQLGY